MADGCTLFMCVFKAELAGLFVCFQNAKHSTELKQHSARVVASLLYNIIALQLTCLGFRPRPLYVFAMALYIYIYIYHSPCTVAVWSCCCCCC